MNQDVRNLLDRAELAPRWSRAIRPAPILPVDGDTHAIVTEDATFGERALCLPYLTWETSWKSRTWT